MWDRYKVHLIESSGEDDVPNLVTNVTITLATVADNAMNLAARDCLPAEDCGR
ncbi:hypothetical protein Spla01_06152 [Streptomyces platensis]|uniref:Uncharacterized protein n=1 Tax=Streptomyces platensis TaxID=58346 RepID=A0ABX3XWZ7_STRPT|nr:hypothetical protein BG653_03704 [Streptomyces platensis]